MLINTEQIIKRDVVCIALYIYLWLKKGKNISLLIYRSRKQLGFLNLGKNFPNQKKLTVPIRPRIIS